MVYDNIAMFEYEKGLKNEQKSYTTTVNLYKDDKGQINGSEKWKIVQISSPSLVRKVHRQR